MNYHSGMHDYGYLAQQSRGVWTKGDNFIYGFVSAGCLALASSSQGKCSATSAQHTLKKAIQGGVAVVAATEATKAWRQQRQLSSALAATALGAIGVIAVERFMGTAAASTAVAAKKPLLSDKETTEA